VEEILEAAASRTVEKPPHRDGRMLVTHAIWLCACETMDDSPLWLIYAVGEDGIGWRRLDDGQEPADVVEAQHLTGDHSPPWAVLEWLRGEAPDFDIQFRGDSKIYAEIRRRISPA
jgi:hypothetical protein